MQASAGVLDEACFAGSTAIMAVRELRVALQNSMSAQTQNTGGRAKGSARCAPYLELLLFAVDASKHGPLPRHACALVRRTMARFSLGTHRIGIRSEELDTRFPFVVRRA